MSNRPEESGVMADPFDLIVRTANPQALDETVQQLGAAAVVDGSWNGDTCRVRVLDGNGFVRSAIETQGYGEVVGQDPV